MGKVSRLYYDQWRQRSDLSAINHNYMSGFNHVAMTHKTLSYEFICWKCLKEKVTVQLFWEKQASIRTSWWWQPALLVQKMCSSQHETEPNHPANSQAVNWITDFYVQ